MTATIRKDFLIDRQGKTFALYAGLVDCAHSDEIGLTGIVTELVLIGSEENGQTWMFKATVTTKRGTFTGYGEANPSNVSRAMLNCLPRMAETRAKARALRDAVNAGAIVAFEELEDATTDDDDRPVAESRPQTPAPVQRPTAPANTQRARDIAQFPGPDYPPDQKELEAIQAREIAQMGRQEAPVGELATPAQLRAIYVIAKNEKNMTQKQVDAQTMEQYGCPPPDLTKAQASAVITALKAAAR